MNRNFLARIAFLMIGLVTGIGLTFLYFNRNQSDLPVEEPAAASKPVVESDRAARIAPTNLQVQSPAPVEILENTGLEPIVIAAEPGQSYRIGPKVAVTVKARGVPPPEKLIGEAG